MAEARRTSISGPVATTPRGPADTQRSRVYDAEHLVHRIFDRAADFPTVEIAGSRLTLPVERRFAALASVQSYVDQVLALGWVQDRWPRSRTPVLVRERRGRGSAHYERIGAVIAVPGAARGDQWALRELVVLHELAHHLAPAELANTAQHGADFVGRLLELVDGVIGAEAAFVLRVTFAESGVRAS